MEVAGDSADPPPRIRCRTRGQTVHKLLPNLSIFPPMLISHWGTELFGGQNRPLSWSCCLNQKWCSSRIEKTWMLKITLLIGTRLFCSSGLGLAVTLNPMGEIQDNCTGLITGALRGNVHMLQIIMVFSPTIIINWNKQWVHTRHNYHGLSTYFAFRLPSPIDNNYIGILICWMALPELRTKVSKSGGQVK